MSESSSNNNKLDDEDSNILNSNSSDDELVNKNSINNSSASVSIVQDSRKLVSEIISKDVKMDSDDEGPNINNKSNKKRGGRSSKTKTILTSNYLSAIILSSPIKCRALLDSGAEDTNIITKSYYEQLKKVDKDITLCRSYDVITPLGSGSLKTVGSTVIKLTLPDGKQTTPIRFTIVEDCGSRYDMILGLPAWQQLSIITKINEGTASIMGSEYELIKNYYQKSAEVRLANSVRLRAGYTTKVPVEVDSTIFQNDPDNYHSVIPSSTFNNTKILTSPFAVAKNELKYIQISNLSEAPIDIKKGGLVAHLVCHRSSINHISMEDLYKVEDEILGDNMFAPEQERETKNYVSIINDKINEESSHLEEEQKSNIINIITKFKRLILFEDSLYPNSLQTKTKCIVPLKPDNNDPLRFAPYRYSPKVKEYIKNTIDGLLENGLITKTTSPWSFPVVVAVKGEKLRFCIDYSKLSDKVIKDSFPLPRIDDTFDHLSKARYFTVVDAASGFWQVPIKEADKEILAFCTPFGNYQWNVMPFGYTNAPAIYQRAMNETLDGSLFINCLVYIDDIIIYSENFNDHLKDINEVFTKLDSFGWKLKLKKCKFAQTKVEYLGHVLSEGQVTVLPKNIEKLKNMKRPTNIKETQAFLGAINYYRRFIQGLTYITEPLLENLRDKSTFKWGDEQEVAFSEIVKKLNSEPILKLPNYDKEFILKTDASGVGYGGVLCQVYDGIEHPVHFFSGSFNKPQRLKWNHWQREAFAVIAGIKRYDHYLRDKKFTVVTDNESILTLIEPNAQLTNHMIDRWRLFMNSYRYNIVHRPGKFLVLEDYLSRSINFFHLKSSLHNITKENILTEQKKDKHIQNIISVLGKKNQGDITIQTLLSLNKDNLVVIDGALYYIKTDKKKKYNTKRLVIPQSLQTELINAIHSLPSGGHLATSKTYWKLSMDVWFEDMYTKVEKFCLKCSICDKNRPFRTRNDVLHPIVATREFQIIEFDHVGPFPPSSRLNIYVLSVIDHFTRKRFFIPVKDTSATTTYQALFDNVFSNFDFPETILTDRGSSFTGKLAEEFAKVTNIELNFALAEQHDTVGGVENSNKQMEDIVRKFVNEWNQSDWDDYVRIAAYALNKSISVTHNYSPDFLLMGMKSRTGLGYDESITEDQKIRNFIKSRKIANDILEKYRDKMILQASGKISEKNKSTFKNGDLIQLKRPTSSITDGLSKKLISKSIGIFEVDSYDKEKGNVVIKLAPDTFITVKQNQVRLAKASRDDEMFIIKPTKLTEVIKINNLLLLEDIYTQNKDDMKSSWMTIKKKELIDVKEVVGKRICIEWKYGKSKGLWKGTVIGYTSNLSASLIFYDIRTEDVPIQTDYYAENLKKKSLRWKFI